MHELLKAAAVRYSFFVCFNDNLTHSFILLPALVVPLLCLLNFPKTFLLYFK